jgi:hypothetical protein
LDDLRHAVVVALRERSLDQNSPGPATTQDLEERIRRFVRERVNFCESISIAGRLAKSREADAPAIAVSLNEFRRTLRQEISELFSSDLQALSRGDRERALGTIFVLASFESWDLHDRVLGLSHKQIERGLIQAIHSLIQGLTLTLRVAGRRPESTDARGQRGHK